MNFDGNATFANVAASTANAVNNNTSLATPVDIVQLVPSMPYAKHFSNISKIEVFGGQNYKRLQVCIFSILDMHAIASAIIDPNIEPNVDLKQIELWTHTNKMGDDI
ncbi:conserved hypothetical protein [Ricinus communis]|uniref:Uncharacterized protein n=1 Tax=Ricinus communis TaxID=3988 RepID=B9SYD8_RICCO|nr:conserved hypothetical protein [Ricinus communis]